MATINKTYALNRELARKIHQEAQANPQSPYAGKLVGLANGEVVVVANTWKEVRTHLLAAEPYPAKHFTLVAGIDASKPVLFAPEVQPQNPDLPTQHRSGAQITLVHAGGHLVKRVLLAETGEGGANNRFDLLLTRTECLYCWGVRSESVILQGAYSGEFPIFLIRVVVPEIGFDDVVSAVGVPETPIGFDGIVSAGFLKQLRSGKFGSVEQVERVLFGGDPLTPVAEIEARNRELVLQVNREARSNPQSPYAGKRVGIANGKVVVVGSDWAAVSEQLQAIEPDRRKKCCFPASADFDKVNYV